jgi:pyruvate ferredoxin oxidoreductase gamma subunit
MLDAQQIQDMHEIRLVGRGGQGIVTAGELLGRAAVLEGRCAQAIPTFGPERRGALSSCTLRVADKPIGAKFSGIRPHVLVVLDPTIWRGPDVIAGLQEGGTLIFNIAEPPESLAEKLRTAQAGSRLTLAHYRLFTVDATGIALEVLKRAITNTAMMGALVGATELLRMDSVERVLAERFGSKAEQNIQAARAARDGLHRLTV